LVHDIMFGPDWGAACPSCTEYTSEFAGALIARLRSRDTAFAMVCRAPAASCARAARFSTRTRPTPGGLDHVDFAYSFLDMTALGRQEAWEEPKDRAPMIRDTL
jgi:predicted dithiol-disulfide oxidoreductase (DUF899 family)